MDNEVEYLECDCDGWKISMPQITSAQTLAWTHNIHYKGRVFKYCPWCGKKREIKMENTSNKIMKISEYDNSVTFRAACSCMDPDHDLWIEIEEDKKLETMTISFTAKVCYYYDTYNPNDKWHESFCKWIKNINIRLRNSIKLLFTGYLEMETGFMMTNEKDIDDFISALQQGRDKIRILNLKNMAKKENKCGGIQKN